MSCDPLHRRRDRRSRGTFRFERLEPRRHLDADGLDWPDSSDHLGPLDFTGGDASEGSLGSVFDFPALDAASPGTASGGFSALTELSFDSFDGGGQAGSSEFFVLPGADGFFTGSGEFDIFPPIDVVGGESGEYIPIAEVDDSVVHPPVPIDSGEAEIESPGTAVDVVATEPADGDSIQDGIEAVTIVLNTPLDAGTVPFGNLVLEHEEADGTWSIVAADSEEWLDFGGTRLTLPLTETLKAGVYRLSLSANAFLVAEDGGLLVGDGTPRALSTFTVAEELTEPVVDHEPAEPAVGPALADAIDLGVVDATVRSEAGTLDAGSPDTAVRLYRIAVGAGHHWRLGLEVAAERDDSPLDAQLGLYDAAGRLIDAADLGRSDAPSDPFLFAGVGAGFYYVAVAPAGVDLANGGYDPTTGRIGRVEGDASSGAFTLSLVADPADAPTRVAGFTIDRADPADPRPSGFTIRFDGAVVWSALGRAGTAGSGPLEVVSDDGRVVSLAVVGYDESTAALSLLLNEPLSLGMYSIRATADGGLTDLAGRVPEAAGQEAGTLARFAVTSTPTTIAPNDLGTLFPTPSLGGTTRSLALGAGESTTLRFVVAFEGFYLLELGHAEGFAYTLSGPDGTPLLDGQLDPTATNGATLQLEVGEYLLTVRNNAPGPREASFEIRALSTLADSVLPNGVGAGPALGLRLLAPPGPPDTPSTFSEATPAISGGSAQGPALLQPINAPGDQPTIEDGGGSTTASGLLLTRGAELIGRPSEASPRIAAVTLPGAIAATASLGDDPGVTGAFGQGGDDNLGSIGDAIGDVSAEGGWAAAIERTTISPMALRLTGRRGVASETAGGESPIGDDGLALASLEEALAPVDPDAAAAALLAPAQTGRDEAELEAKSSDVDEPKLGIGVALASAWAFGRRLRRRRRRGAVPGVRAILPSAGGPFSGRRDLWSFRLTKGPARHSGKS